MIVLKSLNSKDTSEKYCQFFNTIVTPSRVDEYTDLQKIIHVFHTIISEDIVDFQIPKKVNANISPV